MDLLTEQSFAILRHDGRTSFSDIARQLNTNRANIAKRLNPLLQSGDIRIIAAVHPRLLGLHVLAHLSIQTQGDAGELAERICQLNSPVFVSERTGRYQLISEVHAATMAELHDEIRAIRALAGVIDMQVLVYERTLKSFFLGEEPALGDLGIDATDLAIMELLQNDGRMGYAELASAVDLSISGCRTRLNRLTETGAMRIGLLRQRTDTSTQLTFGFGFVTHGDQEALAAIIDSQPGIEFLARTIGRFDHVATVSFPNLAEFNDLVATLRVLAGVTSLETWLHARIHKERYQHSLHRIRQDALPSRDSSPQKEVTKARDVSTHPLNRLP
ncbi:MAG: Lrp/AsnC family transcriptional regulator [Rhodoglobus sp.]